MLLSLQTEVCKAHLENRFCIFEFLKLCWTQGLGVCILTHNTDDPEVASPQTTLRRTCKNVLEYHNRISTDEPPAHFPP